VEAAMEMTRCRSLEQEPFDRVSDGQRQLVRLARALCQQPRVLLLDEPTSFLDVRYKLRLLKILRELVQERKLAVLMSVHELDIALKAPDRVLLLEGGRQIALTSPENLAQGNQVAGIFGLSGGFVREYACLEPAFAQGPPQVFVAGRQGALGVYRLLSRQGIPFACGVLEEGDLVCPAARVLSSRVVTTAQRDALPEVLGGVRQIWLLPDADEETKRQALRCGVPVLQKGD
jgi:iron complex transport system ATP-binding protein